LYFLDATDAGFYLIFYWEGCLSFELITI